MRGRVSYRFSQIINSCVNFMEESFLVDSCCLHLFREVECCAEVGGGRAYQKRKNEIL